MRLQADLATRGATLVGLQPERMREAQSFVKQQKINYPVLAEAGREFEAYGVRRIPSHFLVDPEGRIVTEDIAEAIARLQELPKSANAAPLSGRPSAPSGARAD